MFEKRENRNRTILKCVFLVLNTKTRWRSTTKTRAFIKDHYKILNTHTILKYTPFDFTLLNARIEEAKRNETKQEHKSNKQQQSSGGGISGNRAAMAVTATAATAPTTVPTESIQSYDKPMRRHAAIVLEQRALAHSCCTFYIYVYS